VPAVRKVLIVTALILLGAAGTASAQGSGTMTLTPSKVSARSTLTISLTGLTGFTTLPSSVEFLLQPGFTASAKAVAKPCTSTQAAGNACPSASQIGTGTVGASVFGTSLPVPIKLFLGVPLHHGDIASVIISGSVGTSTLTTVGQLTALPNHQLELLFANFPSEQITLVSFALSVHASHTVTKRVAKVVTTGAHKHKVFKKVKTTYSLLTNPSKCTGAWTGSAILTYSTGTDTLPLSAACTTG
jgi:hypothetical protein